MTDLALNPLERSVLDAFLAGDHPALDVLRAQREVAEIRAREISEFGFLTDFWIPDGLAALDAAGRFALDDIFGVLESSAEEVCFLLHVNRGRLQTLEAFLPEPIWPEEAKLERVWNVRPNPEEGGQLTACDVRDLEFALRGLDPENHAEI